MEEAFTCPMGMPPLGLGGYTIHPKMRHVAACLQTGLLAIKRFKKTKWVLCRTNDTRQYLRIGIGGKMFLHHRLVVECGLGCILPRHL